MNEKTVVIKPGDKIIIEVPMFRPIPGTVRTAVNWGTDLNPNWYIEFDGPNGYAYWKQGVDGGKVRKA